MKKIYTIQIDFMYGNKKLNKTLSRFDLGIDGVMLPRSYTITTTTKPNKKMEAKYIKAIKMAYEGGGMEVNDIKVINKLKKK